MSHETKIKEYTTFFRVVEYALILLTGWFVFVDWNAAAVVIIGIIAFIKIATTYSLFDTHRLHKGKSQQDFQNLSDSEKKRLESTLIQTGIFMTRMSNYEFLLPIVSYAAILFFASTGSQGSQVLIWSSVFILNTLILICVNRVKAIKLIASDFFENKKY